MSCKPPVVHALMILATAPWLTQAAEPGFVEDFNGVNQGDFVSFAPLELVPSGGVGGAGDGYLKTSRQFPNRLGAHSELFEFVGDLIADGVGGYSFYLNDLGTSDGLEVHVGLGAGAFDPNGANFWQTVNGFSPPTDSWQRFSVDFTDESQWVQIIGTGTFADALSRSEKLLFRHDTPPFLQEPEQAAGDFGLDRIEVLAAAGGPAPVPEASQSAAIITTLVVMVAGTLAIRARRPESEA